MTDSRTIMTYELILPYFKQGDDLRGCMVPGASHSDAFQAHADRMTKAARILQRLADVARSCPEVQIEEPGCHFIAVSGPEEILAPLVADGTLTVMEDDEEEDEECSPDDMGD